MSMMCSEEIHGYEMDVMNTYNSSTENREIDDKIMVSTIINLSLKC